MKYMKYNTGLLSTKIQIEWVKEYGLLMEELIEKYKDNHFKMIEDEIKNMPKAVAEQYWDYKYYDDIVNLRDIFPQKLRETLFISCHSILEVCLNNLCNVRGENKKIKLGDLKGKGIERAKTYLKKVVEIDFPDETKEWAFLKGCNDIRNIFVHNLGKIYIEVEKYKKVKEFILNNTNLISLVDFNNIKIQDACKFYNDTTKPNIYSIILGKEFIPYYLKMLDQFIMKLNDIL